MEPNKRANILQSFGSFNYSLLFDYGAKQCCGNSVPDWGKIRLVTLWSEVLEEVVEEELERCARCRIPDAICSKCAAAAHGWIEALVHVYS